MKWSVRILCLAMALCLMVCPLTGCSDGNKPESSGGESVDVGVDFEGKTVTVACWVDMTPKLGESDHGDAQYYAYEWVKKNYNCDIEFISMPETDYFETFISKSLAGNKFADVVTAHCWNYSSWISQGLLLPLTEYMKDADPEHWNTKQPNYRNEIWNINALGRTQWPQTYLLVNNALLSELNLENPQDLARRGEWTWDKFRAYCKAAVKDTNNDGKTDRYGLAAFWFAEILNISSDFNSVYYDESDGKFYNAWTHPATKKKGLELLQFMQDMKVTDGSVMGNTIGGTTASEEMMEGFRTGNLLFCMSDANRAATFKKEGMDFSPVTLPLGLDNKKLKNYIQSFSFYAIPKYKDFKTADLVKFWMDCQTTWDPSRGNAYDPSTVEDDIQEEWATCFNTEEDARFMYDMAKDMELVCTYDSALATEGNYIWKLYQPVLRNTSTPAAVVEATDSMFQGYIDDALNGPYVRPTED